MGMKLGALAFGVVAAFACWPSEAAAGPYARLCVQQLSAPQANPRGRQPAGDPFEGQTDHAGIAAECAQVAQVERGVKAARARFYAGRAYRIVGQTDEAIRHLENAVSAGPDFPNQFTREERGATLELIQAYRERGRFDEALARLDQAIRPSIRRGPVVQASDPAVAYQRAMLVLADRGIGERESAFNALRPVFSRSNDSLTPLTQREIANGRAWLFRLGRELGEQALIAQTSSDRAQREIEARRAVEFLTAAADTVRYGGWGIGAPEDIRGKIPGGPPPTEAMLADVFAKLGNAKLRAAGLTARVNGPDLDCLGGDRSSEAPTYIREAKEAFSTIMARYPEGDSRSADAHWGYGCAMLAGLGYARDRNSDLAEAIRHLSTAQAGRPVNLLTLARAQAILGPPSVARPNYQAALAALTGPDNAELRSEIHVDIARTYLFNSLSFDDPNPTDLSRANAADPEAIRNLRSAVSTHERNTDAHLMLAQIYLSKAEWASARSELSTLLRAAYRLDEGDPAKAQARYFASRLETLAYQQARYEEEAAGPHTASYCRRTERDRLWSRGECAVNLAMAAFNSDQTSGLYRRQVCIARTLFGVFGGESYCTADRGRDGDEFAQALLFEGMYYLRRAHRQPAGIMQDNWALSLRAFETGLNEVAPGVNVDIYPFGFGSDQNIPLRDLLRYGERYVRLCAGLGAGDNERASKPVRDYFRVSGMEPCISRN
jgi:tetratricopeptide (TPR) repeat protein